MVWTFSNWFMASTFSYIKSPATYKCEGSKYYSVWALGRTLQAPIMKTLRSLTTLGIQIIDYLSKVSYGGL